MPPAHPCIALSLFCFQDTVPPANLAATSLKTFTLATASRTLRKPFKKASTSMMRQASWGLEISSRVHGLVAGDESLESVHTSRIHRFSLAAFKKALRGAFCRSTHSGPLSGWFGSGSDGLPGCNSDFCLGGTSAERSWNELFFRGTNFLTKNAPNFSRNFEHLFWWVRKNTRKIPAKSLAKFPSPKSTDELLQEGREKFLVRSSDFRVVTLTFGLESKSFH